MIRDFKRVEIEFLYLFAFIYFFCFDRFFELDVTLKFLMKPLHEK